MTQPDCVACSALLCCSALLKFLERLGAAKKMHDRWPPSSKADAHDMINTLKNGGRDAPASEAQKSTLRKLKIPGVTEERMASMTQGEASKLISAAFAARNALKGLGALNSPGFGPKGP